MSTDPCRKARQEALFAEMANPVFRDLLRHFSQRMDKAACDLVERGRAVEALPRDAEATASMIAYEAVRFAATICVNARMPEHIFTSLAKYAHEIATKHQEREDS